MEVGQDGIRITGLLLVVLEFSEDCILLYLLTTWTIMSWDLMNRWPSSNI